MMLIILIILAFGLFHGWRAWTAYQEQTAPMVVLGLWLLGLLNIISGISLWFMSERLAIGPTAIGVASIELGSILYGYWTNAIQWPKHAVRIASEIFVVGLLTLR